jgi:hypothetical protein
MLAIAAMGSRADTSIDRRRWRNIADELLVCILFYGAHDQAMCVFVHGQLFGCKTNFNEKTFQ